MARKESPSKRAKRRLNKLIDQDAIGHDKTYLKEGTATTEVVSKMWADFAEAESRQANKTDQRNEPYREAKRIALAQANSIWEADESVDKPDMLRQLTHRLDVHNPDLEVTEATIWEWLADADIIPAAARRPGRPHNR